MGLAFCGSGIGNIFLQQVAARLLSNQTMVMQSILLYLVYSLL